MSTLVLNVLQILYKDEGEEEKYRESEIVCTHNEIRSVGFEQSRHHHLMVKLHISQSHTHTLDRGKTAFPQMIRMVFIGFEILIGCEIEFDTKSTVYHQQVFPTEHCYQQL